MPISVSISSNLVKELFFLQLWSSSSLCILYWISQRCGVTEQNLNETFVSWYQVNNKEETWHLLGETQPTSQSRGASGSGWLWRQALCLYSVLTDTNEPNKWSSRAFRTVLSCMTIVWFQKCKIKPHFDQTLFAAHSFYRTRHSTYCTLRKLTSSSRSSLLIFNYWIYWTFLLEQQVFIHSWRHTKLQKQKDFSPQTVWLPWQNAEYRTSPIRRFLQWAS